MPAGAAVLDVKLRGETEFPVVDFLHERVGAYKLACSERQETESWTRGDYATRNGITLSEFVSAIGGNPFFDVCHDQAG